jgi:SAM-dependent methyltransferase
VDERFAARYGELESWHWWFRGRERILASVLARELARAAATAPPGAPRRLVTVGSGPPAGLAGLARRLGGGATLVGVDADPSGALRRLRAERRDPLPAGVDFVWGCIERTPLRAASCDAALALDVIEHVDDDAAALAEAARVVRPGGFVLATVPALPSLWGNQDVVSHHKRRYTARSLAGAFARAGIPLTWSSYFNTALFPAVAAVRWSRRLLGSGQAESDFESGSPGAVNEILARVFAAERHLVGRVRLPAGVSLIGVARRAAGA